MKLNSLVQDSLALLFGMLLTLAFAPFHLFPLAIISPAVLLGTWLNASPKKAFWRGWLFGVGLFSTGVSWVYISIHTYGNTSPILAGLITALFIALLALFPALNGYLLNRYFPLNNSAKRVYAFPAIWVFLEWVRSWIVSGFPWLLIGYSQINNSFLKGYAPIFSVFGVSLAVLLCSSLLVNILIALKNKQRLDAIMSLAQLILISAVGSVLSSIAWTHPTGQPIKVSLVQGNIPQSLKWLPEQIQPTLDRYEQLSQSHWDSNLVIWPESAVPITLQNAESFLENINSQAKQHQSTLITGIPIKADTNGYYNSVIALGNGEGVYLKRRLVPFGEYIPFQHWLGRIFDLLQVPMSDFIPGMNLSKPIYANGIKIATFICYEIAYPEQVLLNDESIGLLLAVSNDAWFGKSIAQAQHLETAQMRALELGRPLLFVANDGITAIINPKGKIQSSAPTHQTYVLTDLVQTTQGKTPWQRFAMDPILIIIFLFIITAIRRRKWES